MQRHWRNYLTRQDLKLLKAFMTAKSVPLAISSSKRRWEKAILAKKKKWLNGDGIKIDSTMSVHKQDLRCMRSRENIFFLFSKWRENVKHGHFSSFSDGVNGLRSNAICPRLFSSLWPNLDFEPQLSFFNVFVFIRLNYWNLMNSKTTQNFNL